MCLGGGAHHNLKAESSVTTKTCLCAALQEVEVLALAHRLIPHCHAAAPASSLRVSWCRSGTYHQQANAICYSTKLAYGESLILHINIRPHVRPALWCARGLTF